MLADIVGACSGLRDDALTDAMRTHCYVALDFKEEMCVLLPCLMQLSRKSL